MLVISSKAEIISEHNTKLQLWVKFNLIKLVLIQTYAMHIDRPIRSSSVA